MEGIQMMARDAVSSIWKAKVTMAVISLAFASFAGCGDTSPEAAAPEVVEQPHSDLASLRKAVDAAMQTGSEEVAASVATLIGENLGALKESNPNKQSSVDQLSGLIGQLTKADDDAARIRVLQAIKARLGELK